MAQVVELGLHQPLVHGPQAGVVRGDVGQHVGFGQQDAAGRLREAGQQAEGFFVACLATRGRLWRGQFHGDGLELAAREPAAQREQGEQRVFDPLARHRARTADVCDGEPVAARFALQLERGAVGYHRHVAREVLKADHEVRARRERVAHHVHVAIARGELGAQPQVQLAGACHGQLPQLADPVHIHACMGLLQGRQVDAGLAAQLRHGQAFGGHHVGGAAHPGGGTCAGSHRVAIEVTVGSGFTRGGS